MALFRANSFVFRPSERTLAQNPRSKLINNEIYNFARLAKTHLRKLTGKIFRTIISTSRFLIDIFVFPFPPPPPTFCSQACTSPSILQQLYFGVEGSAIKMNLLKKRKTIYRKENQVQLKKLKKHVGCSLISYIKVYQRSGGGGEGEVVLRKTPESSKRKQEKKLSYI